MNGHNATECETSGAASANRTLSLQNGLENGEQKEMRSLWASHLDFFLSCLGYAVGLGNVWRFPYLCYRNGGGAFLVPYIIILGLCGLPLFFMELSLGQYHGKAANVLFRNIAPAFHGVGIAMLVISFLVVIYYNVIIAWVFFYMFASFKSKLDYADCSNSWNSPSCFEDRQNLKCEKKGLVFWNNTCVEVDVFCDSLGDDAKRLNATHCIGTLSNITSVSTQLNRISPAEDFFRNYMLGLSPSIDEFGSLRWPIVLCLLLSWIVIGGCLIKGVKSSGKVVYFTALFPYVVLFVLLIRGATLEGAKDGIYFFIVPTWEKLSHAQVWVDAAVQIFYSLGLGFGCLLTLSSYNQFNNNCYRDAILISIANCGTSIFAGFVIFSILGFMAHNLGVPVGKVIESGPGLAFIAYPTAVTEMPLSPLWAFLFFFMLITLGLDSQFAMCETLISASLDEWPSLRKCSAAVVIGTCIVGFLLGLPLCAQGGLYLFKIMDQYSASWSLLIICSMEVIMVSWVYGLENFKENIKDMIGKVPNAYWTVCWKGVSPIVLLGIMVFDLARYTPVTYAGKPLPMWANAVGWLLALSSVSMIPIFGIWHICSNWKEKRSVRSAFEFTTDWGPSESGSASSIHVNEMVEMASQNDDQTETNGKNNPAFIEDSKT